ncbi:MAG: protein translocase subunit SecF [Candidatus Komeilibacteria bacterium]|nr:protein translocase subunit SecF [Candidatus Komeilibacteria bacterium]
MLISEILRSAQDDDVKIMKIIQNRKIYFSISAILLAVSIAAVGVFGFNLGIDFTGGSLMAINVSDQVKTSATEIHGILTVGDQKVLESAAVQPIGDKGFLIRFKDVTETEHQEILAKLRAALAEKAGNAELASSTPPVEVKSVKNIQATDKDGNPVDVQVESVPVDSPETSGIGAGIVVEDQFESIGPTVGKELLRRSIYSILAVLSAIIIYIAWAFRKVSQPVSSWKYGVAAVIALTHDVVIPCGIFAVLGHFWGVEIDILFITALLTMLGFSVHDTIVVFDRTRENLARARHQGSFEETVNQSVNETIRRSINTSMTAFLALLAMYLFGGDSVKYFVLALMMGIIFGTYSSIFIASPLLVVWNNWSHRGK